MDTLRVSRYTLEDIEVVAVEGEVDVFTAPRMKEALDAAIQEGATRVAVNLERVRYLDSTGLSVLVGAMRRLRAVQGRLCLVTSSERIRRVLDLTGLTRVFPISATEPEARRRLHPCAEDSPPTS